MSSLWRAQDVFLKHPVVLRLLDPAVVDPAFSRRFDASLEAASSRFSHPNVAQVLHYGTHRRRAYVVMEAMEGRTLAAKLSAEGVPTAERAASIAADVAEALDAAHRAGVVHGGIHPGSIILTTSGIVKALDFGVAPVWLAMRMNAPPPETSRYQAPEIAAGDSPTPTSDAYSVGALLYHMLTGHPPPPAFMVTAARGRSGGGTSDEELGPAVPPSVAQICRQALGDRDTRPSCGAIAAALRSSLPVAQHSGARTERPSPPGGSGQTPPGSDERSEPTPTPSSISPPEPPSAPTPVERSFPAKPRVPRIPGGVGGRRPPGARHAGAAILALLTAITSGVAGFVTRSARATRPGLSAALRTAAATSKVIGRKVARGLGVTWRLLLRWARWVMRVIWMAVRGAGGLVVASLSKARRTVTRMIANARARRARRRALAKERRVAAAERRARAREAAAAPEGASAGAGASGNGSLQAHEGAPPVGPPPGLVLVDPVGGLDPSIARALQESPDVELLAHVSSEPDIMAAIRAMKGGRRIMAVVGLDRPDDEAVYGLIRSIRDALPYVRIVVAGPAADASAVSGALFAGGDSYVATGTPPGQVVDAVLRTAEGEVVLAGLSDD